MNTLITVCVYGDEKPTVHFHLSDVEGDAVALRLDGSLSFISIVGTPEAVGSWLDKARTAFHLARMETAFGPPTPYLGMIAAEDVMVGALINDANLWPEPCRVVGREEVRRGKDDRGVRFDLKAVHVDGGITEWHVELDHATPLNVVGYLTPSGAPDA